MNTVTVKRKYVRHNRPEAKVVANLSPLEKSFIVVLKDNQTLIEGSGSGSLPIVIGLFIQKHFGQFTLDGKPRKRLLNSILKHLEEVKAIRLQIIDAKNFPVGSGIIALT